MVRHKTIPFRSISCPTNGDKEVLPPPTSFWAYYSVPTCSSSPPSPSSAGSATAGKSKGGNRIEKEGANGHKKGAAKGKRGADRRGAVKNEDGFSAMDVDDADMDGANGGGETTGKSKRERAKLQRRLTMEELDLEKKAALKSHPLASADDAPTFSDLQLCITQAIVSIGKGKSVSMEDITDFVSKRWRNLRRRDGSHYTTGCMRAIQANLRTNPNGVALFKRDLETEGNWMLCETMEEALAHMKKEGAPVVFKSLPVQTLAEAEEEEGGSPPASPSPANSLPNSPKGEADDGDEEGHRKVKKEGGADDFSPAKSIERLSNLQRTISNAIYEAGGSCHIDFIVDTVGKRWNEIKIADNLPRSANVRKMVLNTLARDRDEDAKAYFTRDHAAESKGYWKLGSINPYQNPKAIGVPTLSELAEKKLAQQQRQNAKETAKVPPPITGVQGLIIEAIAASTWSAEFETIYEHVSQRWSTLKRRDGTPYAAGDCRKLIQSSLNNNYNPTANPLFLMNADETQWTLAPRSFEYLRENEKLPPRMEIDEEKCFSNVQRLVIEAIIDHGGAADFDTILSDATKKWNTLRRKDGGPYVADPKRSIQASLLKAGPFGPIFEKDNDKEDQWRLTDPALAIWYEEIANKKVQESLEAERQQKQHTKRKNPEGNGEKGGGKEERTRSGKRRKKEQEENEEEEEEEMEEDEEAEEDEEEEEEEEEEDGEDSDESENNQGGVKLTAMQELTIRLICKHGGSCHINKLMEELTKELPTNRRLVANFRHNKFKLDSEDFTRKDGTPIFKRDPSNSEVWTVADERLAEYVMSRPPKKTTKESKPPPRRRESKRK